MLLRQLADRNDMFGIFRQSQQIHQLLSAGDCLQNWQKWSEPMNQVEQNEIDRLQSMLKYEQMLWKNGNQYVAGIDEAKEEVAEIIEFLKNP